MLTQFQNEWKRQVSGETLPIRLKQKSVLFLKEETLGGQKATVLSRRPEILKVEEKAGKEKLPAGTRRFEVTALQDEEEIAIWATSDALGTQVVDSVEYMILNSKEDGAYYRGKVIELAKSFLGCHYLMGAAGAMPDQMNGMPGRKGAVYMFDPAKHKEANADDIMTSVATANILKFHTCAGRAFKLNPPSAWITDARTKLSAEQLAKENDRLSYRTVYKQGARKGVLLGERCERIRHFDCIGFINYCLSQVLNKNIQDGISGTAKHPNAGYSNRSVTITDDNDDLPGDILIYHGKEEEVKLTDKKGNEYTKKVIKGSSHIAFSLGHNKGRIHASDTEYGVIIDSDIGSPIRRVRYPRLA